MNTRRKSSPTPFRAAHSFEDVRPGPSPALRGLAAVTVAASLLLALVFAALATASLVQAQSPVTLTADVPFDFLAGNREMKAGRYTVTPREGGMVVLKRQEVGRAAYGASGRKGHSSAAVFSSPIVTGDPTATGRLVFHRYGRSGERSFLAEAWAPGARTGARIVEGRLERELTEAGSEPRIATIGLTRS